jgi:hypothetical protein
MCVQVLNSIFIHHFSPKRKSGAKNRINQMKALLNAADADLSIVERRRKQRKIKVCRTLIIVFLHIEL